MCNTLFVVEEPAIDITVYLVELSIHDFLVIPTILKKYFILIVEIWIMNKWVYRQCHDKCPSSNGEVLYLISVFFEYAGVLLYRQCDTKVKSNIAACDITLNFGVTFARCICI